MKTRPESFGPCQFCEYEPTLQFIGPARDLQPTCELCGQRCMAAVGLLREPEFYVI